MSYNNINNLLGRSECSYTESSSDDSSTQDDMSRTTLSRENTLAMETILGPPYRTNNCRTIRFQPNARNNSRKVQC